PGIGGQRILQEQPAPQGKSRTFDYIATAKLMFAHCDPTFEECKLNRDRLLRSRQLRRLWHRLHLSDSATELPFSQLQDEDCKLPAQVLRLTNRLLFESFRDIFPVGGSSQNDSSQPCLQVCGCNLSVADIARFNPGQLCPTESILETGAYRLHGQKSFRQIARWTSESSRSADGARTRAVF